LESKPRIIFDRAADKVAAKSCSFSGFPVVSSKRLGAGYCILRVAITVAPDQDEEWRRVIVRLETDVLFDGLVQGAAALGFFLSQDAWARLPGATLQIQQVEPDAPMALSPGAVQLIWLPVLDDRPSLGEVAKMDAQTVALQFESLGDSCEFGLFQRGVGAEPLGLLRFTGTRLDKLLIALAERFSGFDLPGQIEIYQHENPEGREYISRLKDYAMPFHTGVYDRDMPESEVLARELRRLRYLRRRLIEDLEGAEKIFVIRRDPPLSEHEALPVWLTLREYGPNRLLCVGPAKEGRPAGSIEVVAEGLMMGFVERLAPYKNTHDLAHHSWMELCRNVLAHCQAAAGRKELWRRLWPLGGGQDDAQKGREPVFGRR